MSTCYQDNQDTTLKRDQFQKNGEDKNNHFNVSYVLLKKHCLCVLSDGNETENDFPSEKITRKKLSECFSVDSYFKIRCFLLNFSKRKIPGRKNDLVLDQNFPQENIVRLVERLLQKGQR